MNDIETALKSLVNDAVDDALGARSAPPALRAPQRRAQRANRLLPLLAAAAVIVVAGAATAVALAVHHPQHRQALVQHSPRPAVTYHSVGGARIALPPGWVVRPYTPYLAPQAGLAPAVKQSWCLTPESVPVSTKPRACPIQFSSIRVEHDAQTLDPNTEEGLPGNPEYCVRGRDIAAHSEQWGLRWFGGRAAEWRRVDIRCTAGVGVQFEQYVVDALPAYIVYASADSTSVHTALATIARSSSLPKQTARYRLTDLGAIAKITPTHGGSTMTIARRVERQDTFTYVVESGRASYFVPARVLAQAGKLHDGVLVQVITDGSRVLQVFGVQ